MNNTIPEKLRLSILAFYGSAHCDATDVKSFCNSWLERKKKVIAQKLHARKEDGTFPRNFNHKKLQEQVEYVELAKKYESEFKQFVKTLLDGADKGIFNKEVVNTAEHLLALMKKSHNNN